MGKIQGGEGGGEIHIQREKQLVSSLILTPLQPHRLTLGRKEKGGGERGGRGGGGGEMEWGRGSKRERVSYFLDFNVPPTTEGHIRTREREMDVLQ